MELSPFLPLGQGLKMASTEIHDGQGVVQVVAMAPCSSCPLCRRPATRVHGQYTHQVANLPCAGQPAHLLLRVPQASPRG